MTAATIVIAGFILNLLGGFAYIADTIRGDTKPNRVTWGIWAVVPILGSLISFTEGITWASLPVFAAGFVPLLVFCASFLNKNAYWKLSTLDYVCGAFSVLALSIWALVSQPLLALILLVIADGLAGWPTVVKSWNYPRTESGIAYATGFLSAISSIFAFRSFDLLEILFPIHLAFVSLLLTYAVYRRPIFSSYA